MIINALDLGDSHPWRKPIVGQSIGELLIEGLETLVWPRGSLPKKQTVTFTAKNWQSIGGAAAFSLAATKYLLKQVEELASNRDQQPCYIQWDATAMPGAALNASDFHDGWYILDSFEPDYENYVVTGLVQCRMTVTEVAAAPPRRVGLAYSGGALASNFSGAAQNLLSLPVGSTALESSFTRTGAEGSIPCVLAPVVSPEPLVLSTTIANIFKGGVHVYDTINTGSNPVPTSGGTFVNANWVEVFDTHHDFQGDCVISNGLLLLLFQAGVQKTCTLYLWNTALAVATWQLICGPTYQDNAVNGAFDEAYSLVRVGAEECALAVLNTSTGAASPQSARTIIRLQRGQFYAREDLMMLTQANTHYGSLLMSALPANIKILYNGGSICDQILSESSPTTQTDYGYGCAFIASTAQPFIAGFLYQNQPATQPHTYFPPSAHFGLGDTTGPALNAQRSYAFFAIPYGVSGSYSTADLQLNGKDASLAGGWISAADAGASQANVAKLPSGTAAGANLNGSTTVPRAVGIYDVWVRLRVTSNASSTVQMQIGMYDATGGAWITTNTYAPNAFATTYAWYRTGTGISIPAAHNVYFAASNNQGVSTNTDWWIDEFALVPKKLTTDNRGPQDLWQEFIYDRSVRLIRQ